MSRGRKCCVPGCNSNYSCENVYTPAFQFPKEESRRNAWIRAIKREESFKPSDTTVVCVHHFDEQFIIREDRITRNDGSLLVVPRKKLALTTDSYPTKFPNCPSYLTKVLPAARKSPSTRHEAVLARDEEQFQKWCENDTISSFEEFKVKAISQTGWQTLSSQEHVLFYKISDIESPRITVSFKIYNDFSVEIWHAETKLCLKSFKYLLGDELKCDRWTKFDCLLNKLAVYEIKEQSFEDKLLIAATILEMCVDNGNEESNEKLQFLEEQIRLLTLKQLRYSANLIVWCAKFFYSFPSAYIMIRECKVLILPHPSYLKKLSAALTVSSSPDSHIAYLRKKNSLLNKQEKVVNVLLDEIYISPAMDYKGGHLVGSAENCARVESATTIQTFMIVSPFAHNKDVVALFPVRNINAEKLYSYTKDVLQILVHCGYSPLCLISDNNRVNRNMFLLLCHDGNLDSVDSDRNDSDSEMLEPQPPTKPAQKRKSKPELFNSTPNPYCKDEMLFFLFDTPHLIKSIRNNWINQKITNETLYYPNPQNNDEIEMYPVDLNVSF